MLLRSSLLEDIARVPWQASVVFALLICAFCHLVVTDVNGGSLLYDVGMAFTAFLLLAALVSFLAQVLTDRRALSDQADGASAAGRRH